VAGIIEAVNIKTRGMRIKMAKTQRKILMKRSPTPQEVVLFFLIKNPPLSYAIR